MAFNPDDFIKEDFDVDAFLTGRPSESRLDKAVDISQKVTGTLGRGIEAVTQPFQAIKGASRGLSERITERATEAGLPAPLAAAAGMTAAGPELLVDAAATPFRALEKASDVAQIGGEKVTDVATGFGASPEVAAGLGTSVAMAPDILLALLTGKPASNLAKQGVRATGKAARRAFPAERKLTRAIEQAEGRAGIKQTPVSFDSVASDLGISKRVQTGTTKAGKATFKNKPQRQIKREVLESVLDTRRANQQLSPQAARNVVKLFSEELNKGKGFAGMVAKATGKGPSLEAGLVSRALKFGKKEVARQVPERTAPAKALGRVKRAKRAGNIAKGVVAAEILRRVLGSTFGGGVSQFVQ